MRELTIPQLIKLMERAHIPLDKKMRRKRHYIPLRELLASALADKLPAAERDLLRARRVPASTVIKLFTPDHIDLHCWGGSDKWHNLDMKRRGPALKLKDASDTSRAAKALRIDEKWGRFMRKIKAGKKPVKRSRWRKPNAKSANNYIRDQRYSRMHRQF